MGRWPRIYEGRVTFATFACWTCIAFAMSICCFCDICFYLSALLLQISYFWCLDVAFATSASVYLLLFCRFHICSIRNYSFFPSFICQINFAFFSSDSTSFRFKASFTLKLSEIKKMHMIPSYLQISYKGCKTKVRRSWTSGNFTTYQYSCILNDKF